MKNISNKQEEHQIGDHEQHKASIEFNRWTKAIELNKTAPEPIGFNDPKVCKEVQSLVKLPLPFPRRFMK